MAMLTEAGETIGCARRMPGAQRGGDPRRGDHEPDRARRGDRGDLRGHGEAVAGIPGATGRGDHVRARAIHGIDDRDVRDAPTLDRMRPKLLRVTRNRTVLAYTRNRGHTREEHHRVEDEAESADLVLHTVLVALVQMPARPWKIFRAGAWRPSWRLACISIRRR